MKAILISIKPKYVAKILNGEKTIEIRTTMPKCDLPIGVYIYCTKDKPYLANATELFTGKYSCISNDDVSYKEHNLNGKIVAKFTLNKVEEIISFYDKDEEYDSGYFTETLDVDEFKKISCIDTDDLFAYLDEDCKTGYAWHISNLVIFDKPKELGEFWVNRDSYGKVNNKAKETYKDTLTKAPQSFMFIEVGE